MEIISRKDARAMGLNKYFTGEPCLNGHVDLRYVQSGACKACVNANNGRFKQADDLELEEALAKLQEAQAAYADLSRISSERQRLTSQERQSELVKKAQQKKIAKAQLIVVSVRCYDIDREILAGAAWGLASLRFPILEQADVDPRTASKNKAAGTGMYSFLCHPEDVETFQEIARQTVSSHRTDVENRRQQIYNQAMKEATEAASPPPETFS